MIVNDERDDVLKSKYTNKYLIKLECEIDNNRCDRTAKGFQRKTLKCFSFGFKFKQDGYTYYICIMSLFHLCRNFVESL